MQERRVVLLPTSQPLPHLSPTMEMPNHRTVTATPRYAYIPPPAPNTHTLLPQQGLPLLKTSWPWLKMKMFFHVCVYFSWQLLILCHADCQQVAVRVVCYDCCDQLVVWVVSAVRVVSSWQYGLSLLLWLWTGGSTGCHCCHSCQQVAVWVSLCDSCQQMAVWVVSVVTVVNRWQCGLSLLWQLSTVGSMGCLCCDDCQQVAVWIVSAVTVVNRWQYELSVLWQVAAWVVSAVTVVNSWKHELSLLW